MSGFRNAAMAVLCAALLAQGGCGYRPLYGARGPNEASVSALLAEVKIAGMSDRRGQVLRNYLLDRMNPRGEPVRPRYVLSVVTGEALRVTDTRADGTATRADVILSVRYTLHDAESDSVVFLERGEAVATYNLLTARFAAVVSQDEARRRASEALADQITRQVALFLNRRHNPPRAAQNRGERGT